MSKCQICGKPKADDLFAAVTNEPVCSICQVKFIGGLNASSYPNLITDTRKRLGLKDGEFLNQDNADEARKILGRNSK